jgi:hypothetical protein
MPKLKEDILNFLGSTIVKKSIALANTDQRWRVEFRVALLILQTNIKQLG